ncbi:MAG: hypothetical protein ACPHT9_01365, partial [Flavobacteriaceae bacterium]
VCLESLIKIFLLIILETAANRKDVSISRQEVIRKSIHQATPISMFFLFRNSINKYRFKSIRN